MNENIFPIEKTSLPLGRRDTPDHPSVHDGPEALGEVIVKCLHKKKRHPQNIEDARYNTHNDGGGWHSQYIPVVKGRDLGQNATEQDESIYTVQVRSSRYSIHPGACASHQRDDQPFAVKRNTAVDSVPSLQPQEQLFDSQCPQFAVRGFESFP